MLLARIGVTHGKTRKNDGSAPPRVLEPSVAAYLAVVIKAYAGDAHEAIIEFGPAPVPFLGCSAYP